MKMPHQASEVGVERLRFTLPLDQPVEAGVSTPLILSTDQRLDSSGDDEKNFGD